MNDVRSSSPVAMIIRMIRAEITAKKSKEEQYRD